MCVCACCVVLNIGAGSNGCAYGNVFASFCYLHVSQSSFANYCNLKVVRFSCFVCAIRKQKTYILLRFKHFRCNCTLYCISARCALHMFANQTLYALIFSHVPLDEHHVFFHISSTPQIGFVLLAMCFHPLCSYCEELDFRCPIYGVKCLKFVGSVACVAFILCSGGWHSPLRDLFVLLRRRLLVLVLFGVFVARVVL